MDRQEAKVAKNATGGFLVGVFGRFGAWLARRDPRCRLRVLYSATRGQRDLFPEGTPKRQNAKNATGHFLVAFLAPLASSIHQGVAHDE
jgi:hypothetical protein